MSTITIPTSDVGWFEQMVRSMGWAFSKTDVAEKQVVTPTMRRRINKARKEYAEGQTITCRNPQEMQQFFDNL